MYFFIVMSPRPPIATLTYTRFPYTALFRSGAGAKLGIGDRQHPRIGRLRSDDHDRLSSGGAREGDGRERKQEFLHRLISPKLGVIVRQEDRKSTRLNSSH